MKDSCTTASRTQDPGGSRLDLAEQPRSTASCAPRFVATAELAKATAVMRGSVWNRRTVQRLQQLLISTVGSMKVKLLLCCCIGFTLIVLASRSASYQLSLGEAAAGGKLSFTIRVEGRREAVRKVKDRRVGEVRGSEMAVTMAPMALTVGAAAV
ncbi:hypothetical protein FF1_027712 [Malus domestica]|uniref:Uncharacterized protein n=1 Tax=Malus domestica TaxID=3750 RepID=A0A498KHE7_MALDO|nr:hypothetical protein DVH24_025983 [Malus domestica]